MSNPNPKSLVKSEIVAIAYSVVVKQILKLSKSKAEANKRLFTMGEQMGMRVADEYLERDTSSYKPEEVATVLLQGILKEYMGCECTISNKEVKYQKTRFTISFRVTITENAISDFIIMSSSQGQPQEDEQLNYNSIITGFANGCMRSMCYHPEVRMLEGSVEASTVMGMGRNETIFDVEMWKEKEED